MHFLSGEVGLEPHRPRVQTVERRLPVGPMGNHRAERRVAADHRAGGAGGRAHDPARRNPARAHAPDPRNRSGRRPHPPVAHRAPAWRRGWPRCGAVRSGVLRRSRMSRVAPGRGLISVSHQPDPIGQEIGAAEPAQACRRDDALDGLRDRCDQRVGGEAEPPSRRRLRHRHTGRAGSVTASTIAPSLPASGSHGRRRGSSARGAGLRPGPGNSAHPAPGPRTAGRI